MITMILFEKKKVLHNYVLLGKTYLEWASKNIWNSTCENNVPHEQTKQRGESRSFTMDSLIKSILTVIRQCVFLNCTKGFCIMIDDTILADFRGNEDTKFSATGSRDCDLTTEIFLLYKLDCFIGISNTEKNRISTLEKLS